METFSLKSVVTHCPLMLLKQPRLMIFVLWAGHWAWWPVEWYWPLLSLTWPGTRYHTLPPLMRARRDQSQWCSVRWKYWVQQNKRLNKIFFTRRSLFQQDKIILFNKVEFCFSLSSLIFPHCIYSRPNLLRRCPVWKLESASNHQSVRSQLLNSDMSTLLMRLWSEQPEIV